jgi:eukaryotic-like serine/threonine-protein kinase
MGESDPRTPNPEPRAPNPEPRSVTPEPPRAPALSDDIVRRLQKLGRWPELPSSRYTVIDELGRGGMATVYLARDEELGRAVAIKVPNAFDHEGFERRLQAEARALASLEHPGIVPIHDVGRLADGRLFYVMKRIEGTTLRERLTVESGLAERLRIFERICEPVAFAHARGVIHRDLTPENVMVGAFGEVIVMDWGLATAIADVHRDDGTIVGTHGFMAPEQARGVSAAIDHRVDVYGLGAILFLLLSGGPPAADAEPLAVLRRQRIPPPLAAICVKALAADPADRYQSVAALRADIANYRAGLSVAAYKETAIERLLRLGRVYRTAILLVLGYLVMRVAVALFAGW